MQPPQRTARRGGPRTRQVLLATGILALAVAPYGVAATGDVLREGQRNGTANRETQIVANVGAGTGNTGGYATRQSNKSNSGGGAVYGCRSAAGGSAGNRNPCIRANNLSNGFAFEFNAVAGDAAGLITVGTGGPAKRPFTTNATGVATGLNADRVDGQDAAEIVSAARARAGLDADTVDGASAETLRTRWLLVNEAGEIEEQSGGFRILDAYQTNDNVYIDAGTSLAGRGLTATVALQNRVSRTGDAAAEPNFTGLVSVARCQTAAVECAPPSAKNANAFVVAPRTLAGAGTQTAPGSRIRVYVTITE